MSSESKKVLEYSEKLESDGKVPPHLRLLRSTTKNYKNIPIRDFMFLAGELYFKEKNIPKYLFYLLSLSIKHLKKLPLVENYHSNI